MTSRIAVLVYGTISYLIFFVTFLYAIGFLGNIVVPKSIDSGEVGPVGVAVAVNLLLLSLFAVQHSVMARPGFKAWWTKFVPWAIERSTYVLLSSLVLLLLYWQWRPMTAVIWHVENQTAADILRGLYFAGFGLVLYATLLIDHFDLFGLRQVVLYFRGIEYSHRPFATPSLYRFMRHPLYVGWFTAFWVTPTMTSGHLLFSAVATAYILVAVVLEERDLVDHFGDVYVRYQVTTAKFFPFGK